MVDRLAAGIYEQVRLVTGDRGMGKTVLLREFEQEQTELGRWVVRASATRGDAVVGRLCRGLAEVLDAHDLGGRLARAGRDALRRLAGISVGPGGVRVDLEPAVRVDRADELEELLAAAASSPGSRAPSCCCSSTRPRTSTSPRSATCSTRCRRSRAGP
jgi:hypothetical protein